MECLQERMLCKGHMTMLGLINIIAFSGQVLCNVIGGGIVSMLNTTVADVSAENPSKLTPASWAYSMWAAIALLEAFYLARPLFQQDVWKAFEYNFLASCILNCGWVIMWLEGYINVSCAVLAFLWLQVYVMYRSLRVLHPPGGDFLSILTLVAPFSLYLGWVSCLMWINFAMALPGFGALGVFLAVFTLGAASAAVLFLYCDVFFAAAVVWTLYAIGVEAGDNDDTNTQNLVTYTAMIIAALMFVAVIARVVMLCRTNQKGEWSAKRKPITPPPQLPCRLMAFPGTNDGEELGVDVPECIVPAVFHGRAEAVSGVARPEGSGTSYKSSNRTFNPMYQHMV